MHACIHNSWHCVLTMECVKINRSGWCEGEPTHFSSVANTTAKQRNWATLDPGTAGKKWVTRFAEPNTVTVFNGPTGNWAAQLLNIAHTLVLISV